MIIIKSVSFFNSLHVYILPKYESHWNIILATTALKVKLQFSMSLFLNWTWLSSAFSVIKVDSLSRNMAVFTLVSLLSLFLLSFYEMFRRRLDFLHPRCPGKTINE